MSDNIIHLSAIERPARPDDQQGASVAIGTRRPKRPLFTKSGLNMRTSAFRGYDSIEEATPDDLVRDVALDIDKAQIKLKAVRKRLQSFRDQVDTMTNVETKLSAAIVSAQEKVKSPVKSGLQKPGHAISPAELAALVRTLPEIQQRKIEAVIDFLLEQQGIKRR